MSHSTPQRIERDSLGDRELPADVYYGIQTARAVENFPISGWKPYPSLIDATIRVKKAAARANSALGSLDSRVAGAIETAADEILAGKRHERTEEATTSAQHA